MKSKEQLTPWIFFPVTGHFGPLALFLVYWYTSLPPKTTRGGPIS
jgi:hypothetical protein